jgi:hypothetical protein
MAKKQPTPDDGDIQIDDLEARILRAFDEQMIDADKHARERPAVEAQARAVTDQLREAYRARKAAR